MPDRRLAPTQEPRGRSARLRIATTATATWLGLALAAPAPVAAQEPDPRTGIVRSALHDFRVVEVADGLINPHSIAFTPEGDVLVTERPGRLRVIRSGRLLPDPVEGLPEILALGHGAMPMNGLEQAGLRDVRTHPDFARNRLLYVSYVKPGARGLGTLAVARGRYADGRLSEVEEIFHAYAHGNGSERSSMWGGRLAFDGSGHLFITLGDRQWPSVGELERHPAQQLFNHNGTTVRVFDDGRVPEDNPFVGQGDARPEIWTYGHRNAQGLAVHPETGEVWLNEHGPQGGDEVNLLRPGANYGWPVVGYGTNYTTGLAIHQGTRHEGMEDPVHVWVPSIGVSGMIFYAGAAFPEWRGDMLVGGMSGRRLVRLRVDGDEVAHEETLLRGVGRIREVVEGPDGHVWIAIDGGARWEDGPPTKIYRLEPAGRR
jgi:glucose/arabinose dehydrogenase